MKNPVIYIAILVQLVYSCSNPEETTNPNLKPGEGYVAVEGGKIWYGIMGEGTNTPIICLHGGPGGTSRGYYKMSEIAKDRPVILFDQLGNGKSDHHQDTSLLKVDKLVEQVKAITSELDLKEFYVLGGSWGTALGLEYYNKYPEGIKGLVFNSPYFSTPIWTADADTLVAALPDSIQFAIRKAEADSVFDTEAYQAANKMFASKHGRRNSAIKHPYDTLKIKGSPFVYYYMWGPSEFTATGTLRNYDNHLTLRDVKVPTLFTTGEYDEARPPTVKKFSEMVADSEFVIIPNAGHSTLNDNQTAVIAAIKKFIKAREQ